MPQVQNLQWVKNAIDAFIVARLERAGLEPAVEANRATLLRRVTFDLTGLPPTPEEIAAFASDHGSGAYERVVERLLASPQYGERWAQHWLDVVRYAESNGYEVDGERPHAWRYRDYIIRCLNEDRPFDRFLIEQVAGDELARGQDPQQARELLIASGFNRCGPVHLVAGNTDPDVNRQEVLTEMTGGLGTAFLGLTVNCARCHDHKFDPFSQADYYRLQSFFAAAQPREINIANAAENRLTRQRISALDAKIAPLNKLVADLEAPYRKRLTAAKKAKLEPRYREVLAVQPDKRSPQQKKLAEEADILIKITWDELVEALTPADGVRRAGWRAQIHALEAQKPPPPAQAWTIEDDKYSPATHLLVRGDPKRKGARVQPAFPRVLIRGDAPVAPTRLDRIALAAWLTHPDHPLTARVMVNRIWQHHFGRGLVSTPNDFGLHGDRPSHPELLDYLAGEFVDHGWSIKHMQRLMLLSHTYRQASQVASAERARRVDPDNRLLWRMNRQRLEGEALRDTVLAVSGALNRKQGGPMVLVPLEPAVYELIFTEGEPGGLWPVTPDPREHLRRSIYLFAKRNVRIPLMEAFDQPDSLNSCPVRPVSTFAPQALILMNGPLLQQESKRLAARMLRESGPDVERLVHRAYELALARPPRDEERRMARAFLSEQVELILERLRGRQRVALPSGLPEHMDPAVAAALADFCLALLNRNEFLYVN
jgi:hypothetical protein